MERGLVTIAATVVVLAGMRLAAPVLSPLLLAVFFATLAFPIYRRIRRRLPAGVALALLALLLVAIVVGLGALVGLSAAQLVDNLGQYQAQLNERLGEVRLPAVESSVVIALIGAFAEALVGTVTSFFFVVVAILFLVADGPGMMARLRAWLGAGYPLVTRLEQFGPSMQRFFGLRSYLNALTGLGIGAGLWLLGVDFAPLWGVVAFFLSYVPYIGLFVATAPPVILAFAEYGLWRAVAVVALVTVVNVALENIAMPRLLGQGFSLSPFVVFAAFAFWAWLIGPAGALLAMALTQLLVLILDSFPETRGIAGILKSGGGEENAPTAAQNAAHQL